MKKEELPPMQDEVNQKEIDAKQAEILRKAAAEQKEKNETSGKGRQ